jgi:hypothetical protein
LTYFGSVVLERKILKWPHPIFAFLWLFSFWREPGHLFEQFRIPFTQWWLIPSLIKIGLLVLEKIFKTNLVYLYSFVIFFPWRREIPFIWTT